MKIRRIPDSYEQRDAINLELRADPEADGFDGYASTYWTVDSFGTAFAPNAFKKTIKERGNDIFVLWQHDPDSIIGNPTLLKEDKTGLFTKTDVITEVQVGADALIYLRRLGDRLGMSVGFNTVRDRSGEDDDPLDFSTAPDYVKKLPKSDVRIITEAKLWEYSVVTFAANKNAKPTNVRADVLADLIPTLLDDLREGRLDPEQAALIDQLVAAANERAEPDAESVPLTPDKARRNREIAVELALAKGRALLSEVAA